MAEAIRAHGRTPTAGDNLGLWLDKLVHRNRSDWTLKDEYLRFSLQALCEGKRTGGATGWVSHVGAVAASRLGDTVSALHPAMRSGVARPHGRLLVGSGGGATTETSIAFHRIWGVPIIPASALKGLTRSFLANELPPDTIDSMLGSTDRRGMVTFYDAVPDGGRFSLALDGQTPHHGGYYGTDDDGARTVPPTDADSPVPFSYLTVVETAFCVHLGAIDNGENACAALEATWGALTRALEEVGVGAKTSAGYGRFTLTLTNS
jgi:CRISPR/Cas system CMR subunit Cmr6 (Cas7 group RAMP superfamily)